MIEKVKSNIFSDNALPILNFKNKIRNKILEIRNNKPEGDEESNKIKVKLDKELE